MESPSPARDRYRSRTRSLTPRSAYSRSPVRRRRYDSQSRSRSRTRSPSRSPTPNRRNGRYRSRSRSRSYSPERGRERDRPRDYDRDFRPPIESTPPPRTTKIVVERLSKNINEDHLYEIFGQFGQIKDLDVPINRTYGTNRGTAYILYHHEADAERAIAYMHEGQLDGSVINVSIVLPPRKLSPAPPLARRGANIDPRVPFMGPRGGILNAPTGPASQTGGPRRRMSPASRYGPRSDVYRPGSHSPSRSPGGPPPPSRGGGGRRYRSPSRRSYSPRSPSPDPGNRRRDNRRRSPSRSSYDSYEDRRRSRSRSYGYGNR